MIELIRQASKNLRNVVNATPLIHSSFFSRLLGTECHFKLENLQKTGSFKARGAYNRILSLTDRERAAGVVTASSGNHAQGVAWAGALLGVRSTIVMPENTPIMKYMATRGYGGEVVFHGSGFSEAYAHALSLADDKGLTFIPPFDDELVMAGQGTIGLEIMDALPEVTAVVVPIGGGGLISGIATAVKSIKPAVKVYGVEAAASSSCIASFKEGRPVEVPSAPTIADGIAVKRIGDKTWPIIREFVDHVVDVEEKTIAAAILKLLERKKLIAEGAGAVSVAAAMEGRLPLDGRTVFVISGGNIDVTALDKVIRLGLIREGRVVKVSTVLDDRPGELARLTSAIAGQKANILHVVHQREAVDVPVSRIRIDVIIEVEGEQHAGRVLKALSGEGYEVGSNNG
ncbi:MAG: threonine ammonia-lyase [Thermodesulfobacteriota bacterium]